MCTIGSSDEALGHRLRFGWVGATLAALVLLAPATASAGLFRAADVAVAPALTTPTSLTPGRTGSMLVVLSRSGGSSGRVTLSIAGLPTGVSSTPVTHTLTTRLRADTTFKISLPLTAKAEAPPAVAQAVTLSARPLDRAAGTATRTGAGAVTVRAIVDVRVTGVEVTQGIQRTTLPARNPLNPTAALAYDGVMLQQNGRTIVRVYADAGARAPAPAIVARLNGTRDGTPLPGSPLLPDQGPRTLETGPGIVTDAQRLDPAGAYTFTLPASWTGTGRVFLPPDFNLAPQRDFVTALRAEVLPPTASPTHEECATAPCVANDGLGLTGVTYLGTCCPRVLPVEVTLPDATPARPFRTALAETLNVTPVELAIPDGYRATIDGRDHLVDPDGGTLQPGEERGINRDTVIVAMQEMLRLNPGLGEIAMAIGPQVRGGGGQSRFAYVSDNPGRPFTANGHEFHHALGRAHVSNTCGGGGIDWPPDQVGLIHGVALDRTAPSPYRIFAQPAGIPVRDTRSFYDLMSYCAADGTLNEWTSVEGWNELVARFRNGNTSFAREAAPPAPALVVQATDDGSRVAIASVGPGITVASPTGRPAPERAVVRDRAGAVIAQLGMREGAHEGHEGAPESRILQAGVPVDVAAAGSVEIVRDGAVIASRARSASPPTAAFLSPRAGALFGRGRRVDIRWRAADADADRLRVVVEWSADGGRRGSWRPVSIGPDGGRVALPSSYFEGAGRAALRVRVNDGFDEVVATSGIFRTVHRDPTVRLIGVPRTLRADLPLSLRATALDEAARPLGGPQLRWRVDGRPAGMGEQVTVLGLAPGPHRVSVEARDAAGRRGRALATVRVRTVRPALTVLRAPERIARGARTLPVRVATSVAARVVLAADDDPSVSTAAGPAPRTVRVPVPSGSGPVTITVRRPRLPAASARHWSSRGASRP